ncbi:MAG: hypothetical protein ACAH80_06520 [Alphaproteobacteria bacterium]
MTDPRDFVLPGTQMGVFDLTSRFESAASQRISGDRKLRDDIPKQNAVISFQNDMGIKPFAPELVSGPLEVFRAEIKAMALMALLPEQEVKDIVHPKFKHDDASALFTEMGAPNLAKIFKP